VNVTHIVSSTVPSTAKTNQPTDSMTADSSAGAGSRREAELLQRRSRRR
jgi:hypothetical protein